MISESLSNRVYYSAKLPEICPESYRSITEILDRYGVVHAEMKSTKDIWTRDFMPIQVCPDRYKIYDYMPDYLQSNKYSHLISNPVEVCKANNIIMDNGLDLVRIDGGNVVHGGTKVIMTAKVFEENPGYTVHELAHLLEMQLDAELIVLPWDANEIYGHADGIVRFIDDDSVVLTNYRQLDQRMGARFKNILKAHFKTVYELKFNVRHPYKNNWAYINWLQTDRVLVLPRFGVPEDEQAYSQIVEFMPEYRGRIEMADASDLIRGGGCLNCATWTIYQPSPINNLSEVCSTEVIPPTGSFCN
jgi:agmatine/peptidylarginine deiminase